MAGKRDSGSNDSGGPVHRGPEGRAFYGAVTVGERGQVVIPAEARRDHGITPGDKLIVLGSPDGIALMSSAKLLEALNASDELRSALGAAGVDSPAPKD